MRLIIPYLFLVLVRPCWAGEYDRKQWPHWKDHDGDCLDTRHEVLGDESIQVPRIANCQVVGGTWIDPYSGMIISDPKKLDVDHFVPLSNADRSGGNSWPAEKKEEYANDLTDPDHLVAVSASLNRQKGDKGPNEWLPPLETARSWYVRTWLRIKKRWELTLTASECQAIVDNWGKDP